MFFGALPAQIFDPLAKSVDPKREQRQLHRQPTYRKVMWTDTEDDLLRQAVEIHGCKNWSVVAAMVPGRNGKQCRERWSGMLSPELAKDAWTAAEDELLIRLHEEHGNKWAKISKFLPGRSRISLRNRWGWHMRHKFKTTTVDADAETDEGKDEVASSPESKCEEASPPADSVDNRNRDRTGQGSNEIKFAGKSWEELDQWTDAIDRDFWLEVNQPWFV